MVNEHQKYINKNNRRTNYEMFVIEGNYDEGTQLLVRNIESSLYPGLVIPTEFVRNLLDRIQWTRHLVRYTGKFVISGVRYIGIPLYFLKSLAFCLPSIAPLRFFKI